MACPPAHRKAAGRREATPESEKEAQRLLAEEEQKHLKEKTKLAEGEKEAQHRQAEEVQKHLKEQRVCSESETNDRCGHLAAEEEGKHKEATEGRRKKVSEVHSCAENCKAEAARSDAQTSDARDKDHRQSSSLEVELETCHKEVRKVQRRRGKEEVEAASSEAQVGEARGEDQRQISPPPCPAPQSSQGTAQRKERGPEAHTGRSASRGGWRGGATAPRETEGEHAAEMAELANGMQPRWQINVGSFCRRGPPPWSTTPGSGRGRHHLHAGDKGGRGRHRTDPEGLRGGLGRRGVPVLDGPPSPRRSGSVYSTMASSTPWRATQSANGCQLRFRAGTCTAGTSRRPPHRASGGTSRTPWCKISWQRAAGPPLSPPATGNITPGECERQGCWTGSPLQIQAPRTPSGAEEPTRIDGSRCIDYMLKTSRVATAKPDLRKTGGDHLAVCWTISGFGPKAGAHFRITRTANYVEPPGKMSEPELCAALEKEYNRKASEMDSATTWEQLSVLMESAYQAVWSEHREQHGAEEFKDRVEPERAKGTVPTLRRGHPTAAPEVRGQPSVRERRLRRLARRSEELAWQRSPGRPDPRLRSHLQDEAKRLGAPTEVRQEAEEEALAHWAREEERREEHSRAQRRIAEWRRAIKDDRAAWAWLRRRPRPEKQSGDDATALSTPELLEQLAVYWRKIWESTKEAGTTEDEAARAAPAPTWPPMPQLQPLTGADLQAQLRRGARKAAGPDGWSGRELARAPIAWHDSLARLLRRIEEGEAWPRALTQWRQAHIPKEDSPADAGIGAMRPISVAPVVYRAWASARIAQARSWLRAWPDRIQGALPGRSVLSAAWPLLRAAEIAAQGEAAGTRGGLRFLATLDLSKAYDTLGATRAAQALGRTGLAQELCDPLLRAWQSQERWLAADGHVLDRPLQGVSVLPQGDPIARHWHWLRCCGSPRSGCRSGSTTSRTEASFKRSTTTTGASQPQE